MTFPEKLITLRGGRGWSQEQLAKELGVTRQAVGRWEKGSGLPDAKSLMALARVFDVDAEWLMDEGADSVPQRGGTMRFELSISKLDWVMAALAVAGIIFPYSILRAGEQPVTLWPTLPLYLLHSVLINGKYFAFGWLVRILPLSLSRGTAKVCRITGWALFSFLALVLTVELTVIFAVIAPVEGRLSDISRALELLIYFIQSVLSSEELFVAAGLLLGLGYRHRA